MNQKPPKHCKFCNKQIPRKNVYCNSTCQYDLMRMNLFASWEGGENVKLSPNTVRRNLILLRGHQCDGCKLTEWQDQPIPLEVDHMNGDGTDNKLDNLRLLCPNCHAMTDNYKGRNKGKGKRKFRYVRVNNENVQ